jgi:hypothetical protein
MNSFSSRQKSLQTFATRSKKALTRPPDALTRPPDREIPCVSVVQLWTSLSAASTITCLLQWVAVTVVVLQWGRGFPSTPNGGGLSVSIPRKARSRSFNVGLNLMKVLQKPLHSIELTSFAFFLTQI